jgi:antitoxin (DNA-binding transcriptional repressor) of toxin-antitoxin stability system
MRGVCWEAAGHIDSTDIEPLVRIHANWISQTPFGWQRRPDSPDIRGSYGGPHRWGGFWGESDDGIEATTRWAHNRKIHVLLKPHIWTHGGWAGTIAMKNEADWATWFADYRDFILHYADLAERSGAEALAAVAGDPLAAVAPARPSQNASRARPITAVSTISSTISAPSLRKDRDACSIVSLPSEPAVRSASDGMILEIITDTF